MGAFIAVLFVVVLAVVIMARKSEQAGPATLEQGELARATVVQRSTSDAPGEGWTKLGSKTSADGLRLRFDHDDDPQAEAMYSVGPAHPARSSSGRSATIRLSSDFRTHHVHCRGYVFQVRLRGTGGVVGKEVRIKMRVYSDGTPYCGKVENDDDTDAAVGDWIDFESVEILQAPPSADGSA